MSKTEKKIVYTTWLETSWSNNLSFIYIETDRYGIRNKNMNNWTFSFIIVYAEFIYCFANTRFLLYIANQDQIVCYNVKGSLQSWSWLIIYVNIREPSECYAKKRFIEYTVVVVIIHTVHPCLLFRLIQMKTNKKFGKCKWKSLF